MIEKINELIEKYEEKAKYCYSMQATHITKDILSDLEELKKLADSKCPDCNGTGNSLYFAGKDTDNYCLCDTCKGTGKSLECKNKINGGER